MPSASLSDLLDRPPAADGGITVIEPPDPRSVGVFAFTAHHVICAPVSPGWVRSALPSDELSAPFSPPFLSALGARTGLVPNNLDAVLVAPPGPRTGLELARGVDHSWGAHRTEVQVWTADGGQLILGRGVAGRLEAAVEIEVAARGRGLGRALFAAARGLTDGEPVWVQVAPGNAASLRAVFAAGFRPIGAEVLLIPGG